MTETEKLKGLARLDPLRKRSEASELARLAKLVRYYILYATTRAGSGHPTSALSAADLAVCLFFNKLRFDLDDPEGANNDRLIFSKGHVSPLIYALYAAAGVLSEKDLASYRQFKSPLEGHPTPNFKYIEVATGSLGQGLSVGLGMALGMRPQIQNLKIKIKNLPRVYVLMGDSEVSEGSVWEAMELASYYKVGNLVGIIDVNRLGQRGQTMLGWDLESYRRRIEAFGWKAQVIDGHNFEEITRAFDSVDDGEDQPKMIIAKTIKGRGVSFLEDKEGWHGKALSEEEFEKAVGELGKVDKSIRGKVAGPVALVSMGPVAGSSQPTSSPALSQSSVNSEVRSESGKSRVRGLAGTPSARATHSKTTAASYKLGEMVATRKAYGETLARLGATNPAIVSLDAEVGNSTFAQIFAEKFPERFWEMFIAEQNMVGVALGLSKRGKIPFVSTFAAFLTRAFDQIRMSAYSRPNIKFVGSHAGVSIGEDGPSQMGLEDLAMFRAIFGSIIFCPGDAVACAKLVEVAAATQGLFYIRVARPATAVIYKGSEEFKVGGSKVVRSSKSDQLTIVACGVVLIEAIKAADELAKKGVRVRVIDSYSIKPIDEAGLREAALETGGRIVTVEDHYFEGGLGDAVLNVFAQDAKVRVYKLAVGKMPMSGKSEELLAYEGISAESIFGEVLKILN